MSRLEAVGQQEGWTEGMRKTERKRRRKCEEKHEKEKQGKQEKRGDKGSLLSLSGIICFMFCLQCLFHKTDQLTSTSLVSCHKRRHQGEVDRGVHGYCLWTDATNCSVKKKFVNDLWIFIDRSINLSVFILDYRLHNL